MKEKYTQKEAYKKGIEDAVWKGYSREDELFISEKNKMEYKKGYTKGIRDR